jgi:AcrR family transcriptional regulator
MPKENSKEHILKTTITILQKKETDNVPTVRDIAKEANVGVASINYHFHSKENLLREAAVHLLDEAVKKSSMIILDEGIEPKERVRQFILDLSVVFFDHKKLTRLYLSTEFNKGKLGSAKFILPVMRRIFNNALNEEQIKIKTLQLVVPMQYIFLHEEGFIDYMGFGFNTDDFSHVKRILEQLIKNIID